MYWVILIELWISWYTPVQGRWGTLECRSAGEFGCRDTLPLPVQPPPSADEWGTQTPGIHSECPYKMHNTAF